MVFNTWKTSTKETPISEMDKLFVLKASKQCVRKLQFYQDKIEFLKKLRKDKPYLFSICTAEIKTLYSKANAFAHLLQQMDCRAIELGFEVPETIDDITAMIAAESNAPQSITKRDVLID